ncbi:cytochrome P450 [Streptomyces tendae]|uniref:cytochrome P450 n=1 Tax=Streptomyces tendae TaxID=1932 RepID=UPI00384B2555
MPEAPGRLPVIGHSLRVLRDPLTFLTSLPARGDLVQVRMGTFKGLVVCDPELTRQVLLDDRTFDKGGPLFDRGRELSGDGLALSPYRRHRRQRRLAQPAFHFSRFPGYARTMTAQASAVADSWQAGQTLDVSDEMMTLAVRTAVETMFSDELTAGDLQQSVRDLTTVMKALYRRAAMPPLLERLPLFGNSRYHQARARLRRTLNDVITRRRASRDDHGDLLSAFLAARDDDTDGLGMTEAEISDQVLTFFIAGSDSTAILLSWALHLLANHPDVEERVHAEVDSVLAGARAGFSHLPGLELTTRVITETLRLYPPGWVLTRTVTTDTRLGPYSVPAGTTVAYSPYLIHRRGDLYDAPDRFDPDRWAGDHPQPSRHAYIPFGGGARKCIADQFGTIEAVLALATITARWRLTPLSDGLVRPAAAATLNPPRMPVLVEAR